VLAFRGTEGPKFQRMIDPARIQRLFQQSGMDWQETMRRLFAGGVPDMQEALDRIALEYRDLLTDLDALPADWPAGGKVHRGFVGALDRVWPQIEGQLAALDMPVLFTGHSLGAALATLAAGRRAPDTLYTFGSPRVGDAGFSATLATSVVYRYVNCCDIVAQIPPAIYQPLGTLRYIDSGGKLRDDEEDDAAKLQARIAHFRRTFGQWDKIWIRDLVDHAPVNYVKALLAAQ
jgi:predicted lipase